MEQTLDGLCVRVAHNHTFDGLWLRMANDFNRLQDKPAIRVSAVHQPVLCSPMLCMLCCAELSCYMMCCHMQHLLHAVANNAVLCCVLLHCLLLTDSQTQYRSIAALLLT